MKPVISAAETPAESRSGQSPPPRLERHSFLASANPRRRMCEKCGRSKYDAVHRVHPELRRASLIAHLETASKLVREYREDEAAIEVRAWLRIYQEDL